MKKRSVDRSADQTTQSGDYLKRLPAIKADPDDQTEFARNGSERFPHQKPAIRYPVKFPSDDNAGRPRSTPRTTLDVIRYSPEGEVTLAPDLNVTFSQPMVAVTSQEQAAQYAPVELSPQVEGRWRWLGTKTLMFDTTQAFPDGDEIHGPRPRRNKVGERPNAAKGRDVDIHDAAAKGRADASRRIRPSRRDALMFISVRSGDQPRGGS